MAVVYKARDVLLNRYVAIKVLNESLSNDSEFVRRFSREAQAAASLSHPNVVSVYDVGQENHVHYIVMEYIEGPTLKEYIQQYSPLTAEEVVSIASQICDALAHAHENQIIHRDIKPHNILLGRNGRAKVTDFGIARATSSSTITQAGSVMGSVHYFSPEQARGGVIGEKSDIYSLGVVMYEMVTGQLPFDGDSAISIAMKHLQEPVEDPAKLNPDIPRSIHDVIMRALEKDPDRRYPSVRAMKQEIDAVFHQDRMEEPQWRSVQKEDAEKTIPVIKGGAFREGGSPENGQDSPSARGKVGEKTLANLERLRHVPADKNKTVFQRTVVWLENVQANMPWWQKLLFGLFTFVVIASLALFTFDTVMGWMSSDGDTEGQGQNGPVVVANVLGKSLDDAKEELMQQGFREENIEVVEDKYNQNYGEGEVFRQRPRPDTRMQASDVKAATVTLYVNPDAKMVKVDNWIGKFQTRLEGQMNQLPYKVDIVFWNQPGVEQGKIFATDPGPNEYVEQGGTVRVWVSDPNGKTPPPNR